MIELHWITATPVPAADGQQPVASAVAARAIRRRVIAVRIAATGEEYPVCILNWSDARLPLWTGVASPNSR